MLDLVSSHIRRRWEPLAAALGFRDTDDPEFSDCSGEEACRLMLTQWMDEKKGQNVHLTLSVAMKELGLDLLSQRIQTVAETRSKWSCISRLGPKLWPLTRLLYFKLPNSKLVH